MSRIKEDDPAEQNGKRKGSEKRGAEEESVCVPRIKEERKRKSCLKVASGSGSLYLGSYSDTCLKRLSGM